MQNSTPSDILDYDFSNINIGIVCSTYHENITSELYQGALNLLKEHKISNIYSLKVPGAFELIYGCHKMRKYTGNLNGIIALGCVIKGETNHDDYINHAVANQLAFLQVDHDIPIGFGLVTTLNEQQAIDRSYGKHGNKGREAALAVLQIISSKVESL